MAVGFVQAGYALNLSGEASLAYASPNTAGNLLVAYVRIFGPGCVRGQGNPIVFRVDYQGMAH